MNTAQQIAETIKLEAKKKKIRIRDLLVQCGLNINTISDFARGQQISLISFVKIADELECSVDYLLGRTTDNLQTYKIQTGNTISVEYNNVGDSNSVTASTPSLDEHRKLLLDLYNKLSPIEQVELLSNLNKRTSSNENDNGVETVYKVARAASGAEESPGGMIQITKEKLDLLETAPESDIE